MKILKAKGSELDNIDFAHVWDTGFQESTMGDIDEDDYGAGADVRMKQMKVKHNDHVDDSESYESDESSNDSD